MEIPLTRNNLLNAWLHALAIPIAILINGNLITSSIESSKLDSEYVKMALTILNSGNNQEDEAVPYEFTDEQKALRKWAVRLLNSKSPEKFTLDEQKALLKVRYPLKIKWVSPMGPLNFEIGQPSKSSANSH